MKRDPASKDTAVLATYPSRHQADVAASVLVDRGIDAHVVADDVHPPLQMTEGARLVVMADTAEEAAAILRDNSDRHWMPAEDDTSTPGAVRATAWTYLMVFALIVVVVAAGLLLT